MTRIAKEGFFEVFIPKRPGVFRYQLRATYANGELRQFYDPYCFLPTLGEQDLYLFNEGNEHRIYEKLGAHLRVIDGVPGVAIITPLRISPALAVLVDRGFVAAPDARHVDLAPWREPDSADVIGLAFDAPRGRGDADPAALRDSFPYQIAPFILQLQASDSAHPDWPEPNGIHRWPGPDLSNGPHLSYAIQWFSFAIIIAVGSVILFRREPPR